MNPVAEGKTKRLFPHTVRVEAKDRVTWDNQHEADMPGKAKWSTESTCNVFELFRGHKQEVAYMFRLGETSFIAPYCRMIPLEVVGRSLIDPQTSFLKRDPSYPRVGVPLEIPEVEFFLKTSGKTFGGIDLPDADPLIVDPIMGGVGKDGFAVIHPAGKEGHAFIPKEVFEHAFGPVHDLREFFETLRVRMGDLTLFLRDAWAKLGWQLGDWKGEFGFDCEGRLLLADVIDNDSWRLRDPGGVERSKQIIRDAWRELDKTGKSNVELYGLRQVMVLTAGYSFELVAETSKLLPNARPV